MGLLHQLTTITYNFCLLAVFYNLQYPSDNGSCEKYFSEASCLSDQTYFAGSLCAWTPASPLGRTSFEGLCRWKHKTFSVHDFALVNLLIVAVLIPVQVFV